MGKRPSVAVLPARPLTTSLMVPSPPAATILEKPSLTAWRARTGQDKHSIFTHPRYADPQNRDFSLLPNSPNIGAGENGTNIGALGVREN